MADINSPDLIYEDFDQYLDGLHKPGGVGEKDGGIRPEEGKQIRQWINSTVNPEQTKRMIQNIRFVEERVPGLGEIDVDQWYYVRPAVASHLFDVDDPDINEDNFYALVQGKRQDEKNQLDLKKKLFHQATDSALMGGDPAQEFSKWLEFRRTDPVPGYQPEQEARYREIFLNRFKETQEALGPYREQVLGFLKEVGEDDKNVDATTIGGFIDILKDLEPEQQDAALSVVGSFQQVARDRNIMEKIRDAALRGLGGHLNVRQANKIDERASEIIEAYESGEPIRLRIGSTPERELREFAVTPGIATQVANKEQREAVYQEAVETRKRIATERKVQAWLNNKYDPLRTGSKVYQGLIDFAENLPFAVETMVGTAVNPLAGFAVAANAISDQNYNQMMLDNPRANARSIRRAANMMGTIEAVPETMSNMLILGKLPTFNAAMGRIQARLGGGLAGGAAAVAGTGGAAVATEWTEEYVQNITSDVIQSIYASLDEDVPGVDLRETVRRLNPAAEENLRTFFAVLPFAIIGGAAGGVNFANKQFLNSQINLPFLNQLGIVGDEAFEIINEQNVDARLELLSQRIKKVPIQEVDNAVSEIQESPTTPTVQVQNGEYAVQYPGESVSVKYPSKEAAITAQRQWVEQNAMEQNAAEPVAVEQRSPEFTRRPGSVGAAESATEFKERGFYTRFKDDARISEEIRQLAGENLAMTTIATIPNVDTAAKAREFVDEVGILPAAIEFMSDRTEMATQDKAALGQVISMRLNKTHRALKRMLKDETLGADDRLSIIQEMNEIENLSAEVAEELFAFGTEMGRGLQAYSMWAKMSPDGFLNKLKKERRKSGIFEDLGEGTEQLIRERWEEINAAPEGIIRASLYRDMLNEIATNPDIKLKLDDLLVSFWYSNILSGLGTQGANLFGNAVHLMSRIASASIVAGVKGGPSALLEFYTGLGKGAKLGASEALAILQGNQGVVRDLQKWQVEISEIEKMWMRGDFKSLDGLAKKGIGLGTFVFRLLQATDMFFWQTAKQGRTHLAAHRIARSKHKADTSKSLAQLVAKELGYDADTFNSAIKIAEDEVAAAFPDLDEKKTRRMVKIRADEVLDSESRAPEIVDESHRFADLVTFTNKPVGTLGHIANAINKMNQNVVIPTKYGDIPLTRFVVPFVNIVANVSNSSLDYSPLGLFRATSKTGHFVTRNQNLDELTTDERLELAVSGLIGTGFAVALYLAIREYADDDDPPFWVYAAGPRSSRDREILMANGWRPFSIKVGNAYVRYADTVFMPALAFVGTLLDEQKYSTSFSRKDVPRKIQAIALSYAHAQLDNGFLSGLSDLIGAMNNGSVKVVENMLTRTAGGFVPMAGSLRDLEKILSPEIEETEFDSFTHRMWAQMAKNIPIASDSVGKKLNVFGEDITRTAMDTVPLINRFVSGDVLWSEPDPLFQKMAELGVSVSRPTTISVGIASPTSADKKKIQEAIDRRSERVQHGELAQGYVDIYTPEQSYDIVRVSGPIIRQAVEEIISKNEGESSETIQSQIDSRVREIRRDVKRDILYGRIKIGEE